MSDWGEAVALSPWGWPRSGASIPCGRILWPPAAAGINGQALPAAVSDEVAASVGSACHADQEQPSGVLGAMGLDLTRASGAVRLSTGWETSEADIARATDALIRAWRAAT